MPQNLLPPPTPGEIVTVRLKTFDRGYSIYTKKKLTGNCLELLIKDVELVVFTEKHYEWTVNPCKRPKPYTHLSFPGVVVAASNEPLDLPEDLVNRFVELEYDPAKAASFILAGEREVYPVRRAKFVYLTDNNFFAVNPR